MSFDGCISSLNLKSGSVSREFNMEELKGKTDSHLAESRCGEKSEFAFVTLTTAAEPLTVLWCPLHENLKEEFCRHVC